MAVQQYDYKIILLGDAGVGKTSLFYRIKTGRFCDVRSTQGTDRYTYSTSVGDDLLSVTLWDTGGGERFRTLTNNFYRDADAALLVYSVEDSYTFENLKDWIDDANQHINKLETFEWALIGNKCDLGNEVAKERVDLLCNNLQAKTCYVVSAKTSKNVMEAFNNLIINIHRKCTNQPAPTQQPQKSTKVDLTAQPSNKQHSCCS